MDHGIDNNIDSGIGNDNGNATGDTNDDDDNDDDDDDDDGGGKVCWDGCSLGSPCLGVVAESLDSSMGVVSKLIRKQ